MLVRGQNVIRSAPSSSSSSQVGLGALTSVLTPSPGITGQDGSYLAELLIEKGYQVHGIIRRSSSFNTGRIEHLYKDAHESTFFFYCPLCEVIETVELLLSTCLFVNLSMVHDNSHYDSPVDPKMRLHHGDLTDSTCLVHIISKVLPTEIYNLGAQSHVKVSFDMSEYTADVDAVGTLRLLDAIRTCGLAHLIRFYQVKETYPSRSSSVFNTSTCCQLSGRRGHSYP